MSKEEREEIARIIEPRLANDEWRANFAFYVEELRAYALAKADLIIAARLAREALSQESPFSVATRGRVSAADRAFVRHLIREMRSAVADDPISPTLTTGPLDPDILERVLEIALSQGSPVSIGGEDQSVSQDHAPHTGSVTSGQSHAAELLEALTAVLPAVSAYLMSGDAQAQSIKQRVWRPVLNKARDAIAKAEGLPALSQVASGSEG